MDSLTLLDSNEYTLLVGDDNGFVFGIDRTAFDVISVTHRELQDWYKFKRPCITDRTHIKLLDIKPTMVSMSVADQPLNVVPYDEYTLALTKYVRKGYWPNDIISTVLAFDFKKLEWWKYADNLR